MITLYRRPPIDASYQVSVYLAKRLQRKIISIINQSETRVSFLSWPCLLIDRDKIITLYRRPPIDASYQVSFYLAKRLQKKIISIINQSETRVSFLWWPCLLTDRDEMSNLYRLPSIDASYKVSVHLTKRFQRRAFLEIDQLEKQIACGSHHC